MSTIVLTIGAQSLPIQLLERPYTQALVAQLPLTLGWEDFAASEKIAYLPTPLDTRLAPDGCDAKAGDLAYYAPWGNLALFYKDAGYARGLIHLGKGNGDIGRFLKLDWEKARLSI